MQNKQMKGIGKMIKTWRLVLVVTLLISFSRCAQQRQNQAEQGQVQSQIPQSVADWYMLNTDGQNLVRYKNLFSEHQQVNVTSRLYVKQPNSKQQQIAFQSSTLILESEYLKMYRNKLGFKLKFQLTPQIIQAIKHNQTFVQTGFKIVSNGRNLFVEKQTVPVLGVFRHQWREGIEQLMMADMDLMGEEQPQKMVLKHMDVYFFQIGQQLPFTKDFEGSEAFGTLTVQQGHKQSADYYYPRPLASKINTKLKQNYVPFNTLQNKPNQKYEIKIELKIGSHLFPLMMYGIERLHDSTQPLEFDIDGMEFSLGENMDVVEPFIIRYFKKVLFEGSFRGWAFLIIQTFINLSSKMVSILATFFQFQIFKQALRYRGMSLYSILVFIAIDILLVVLSYGYLRNGDFVGPMVSLFIGVWKLRKMATVTFSWEVPFLQVQGSRWYQNYAQKDKKSLIQSVLPSLLWVSVCISYPFIFQNYLESNQATSQSLAKYILYRFVEAINEYRFILAFTPQVLLNFKLKTCNSLTWKLLIALLLFYSVDNVLIPVTTSGWEVVFYLKDEILLSILIFQKIYYGNNLELMPVGQQNKTQKMQQNSQENQNINIQQPKQQQIQQRQESEPVRQAQNMQNKVQEELQENIKQEKQKQQ